MKPATEIHPAFMWTCDSCGVDNFEYSISYGEHLPDHIADEMEDDEYEASEEGSGGWYSYPDDVTCKNCRAEYRAESPGDDS